MAVPLTTLTQTPVQYDVSRFGGDDTQLIQSGFFATIVQWDANAKDDVFKANFVFIMKKAFAFLDMIGIGACIYKGGLVVKLSEYAYAFNNHPTFCATFLARNLLARQQIINALGGEEACRAIPVVELKSEDFNESLKLGYEYFSHGQCRVQGEDAAGRKFVCLRVEDPRSASGLPNILTAYQRFRETESNGGDVWMINSNKYDLVSRGIDDVVTFIKYAKLIPK